MRKRWQVAIWIGLWYFWVALSHNNHPTLLLDGIDTALLLSAYAGAIYVNAGVLVPRYWRSRHFLPYGVSLLLTMCVLTVLVVLAIQAVYDLLWRPDPNRFGFWTNCGLDFIGMVVHLLAATAIVALMRRYLHHRREAALIRLLELAASYNDKGIDWRNDSPAKVQHTRQKWQEEINVLVTAIGDSALPSELLAALRSGEAVQDDSGKFVEQVRRWMTTSK